MTTPAVSVILATYNRPRFLREAVDSILKQTLRDLELILIDDGSPDAETAAITQEYTKRDNRVCFLRQQENQGVSVARNAGLRLARAPYIAIMDDDDISEVQRLEAQLDYLESNPEVAAISCLFSRIDEQGRVLRRDPPLGILLQNVAPHLERRRKISVNASSMSRRTALSAIGAYNEFFRVFVDLDLSLRMEEHFQLAQLERPLYYYRIHKGRHLSAPDTDRWKYLCATYLAAYERRRGGLDPTRSGSWPKHFLPRVGAMPFPLRVICAKAGRGLGKALLRTGRYTELRTLLPKLRLVCGADQKGCRLYRKLYRHILFWSLQYGRFDYWLTLRS